MSILVLFTFSLCSFAYSQNENSFEFCEKKFNQEVYEILKDDSKNLLGEYFKLATYKMTHKIQKDSHKNQTLESYIKKKIKKLKTEDKKKLIKKVSSLYERYGKSADLDEITKSIEGLAKHSYWKASKRISNKDSSIILLAIKEMDSCEDICIDDNDIAITWFMSELSSKVQKKQKNTARTNKLQMSVNIAHLNGSIKNKPAISESKLKEKMKSIQANIDNTIEEAKYNFFEKYIQCQSLLSNKCFQQVVKNVLPHSLKKILQKVNSSQIKNIDKDLKLEVVDGIALNLRQSSNPQPSSQNRFPTRLNLSSIDIVNHRDEEAKMCGGEPFKEKIDDIRLWSFDPLKAVSVVKKYGEIPGLPKSNIGFLCELIPPMAGIRFHCTPWFKKFVLRKKSAKALVCCKEEKKWRDFVSLYVSISGGIDLKAYLGIPKLSKIGVKGEIGLIGGISAGIGLGGGKAPKKCDKLNCLQGALRSSVFLGGYFDFGINRKLNNAIGGEFKISWKPYTSLTQCLTPTSQLPPVKLKYSTGSIWLHGTIYSGWVVSYDFFELLYENNDEDTLSFPIF